MSIESINEPGGSNLVSTTPASINEPPAEPTPPVDETRPPIEPELPPAIPATHHRPRPTTTLPGKRKPLGRD